LDLAFPPAVQCRQLSEFIGERFSHECVLFVGVRGDDLCSRSGAPIFFTLFVSAEPVFTTFSRRREGHAVALFQYRVPRRAVAE